MELADQHWRELETERERTVADLRRVSESRAWRWGHGSSALLRRLTFRKSKGQGGVEVLLRRLEAPRTVGPSPETGRVEPPE